MLDTVPAIQPPEEFYASKNSPTNVARMTLWGGAFVGIGLVVFTSKNGVPWSVPAFVLGFVALLDWYLRRQMRSGKVFVSLNADGIASELFDGKSKRFAWTEVSAVTLTRIQNAPRLQLVLKAAPNRPDKRQFLTSRNPARPVLPLSALNQAEQIRLFNTITAQLQSRTADQATPLLDNQLQEELEFQQRLKAFAPVPWLTYGLIAVNVIVWLASLMYGGGVKGSPTDLLLRWGGNAASEVQRGEWWRMATAMFLHSGLKHVAFNMLGLYSLGIVVERVYGHRLYALIYFGSGLVGSALSLHFAAQRSVSVGASGAVFGIAGAMLIAFLQHRKELPKAMGKQTLVSLGIFILYSLAQGFTQPGIDNAAHVGGLLAGCLLAYVLPERFDMEKFVRQYKQRAVVALVLAIGGTVALAGLAPVAKVDQRGGLYFTDGARKLAEVGKVMERDAQLVKEGKMSEIQSDERSRTVLAPMMRDVIASLDKAKLAETDLLAPTLTDLKRYSALILESLEMQSVVPAGSSKPEPVDPQRMAEIEKEVKALAQHIQFLKGELAKKKGP